MHIRIIIFLSLFLPIITLQASSFPDRPPTLRKKEEFPLIKRQPFPSKIELIDELEFKTKSSSACVTFDGMVYIHHIPSPRPISLDLRSYSAWLKCGNTRPQSITVSPDNQLCSIANREGFVVHIAMHNGVIIHSEQLKRPAMCPSKNALKYVFYKDSKNPRLICLCATFHIPGKPAITTFGSYLSDLRKKMNTKLGVK